MSDFEYVLKCDNFSCGYTEETKMLDKQDDKKCPECHCDMKNKLIGSNCND